MVLLIDIKVRNYKLKLHHDSNQINGNVISWSWFCTAMYVNVSQPGHIKTVLLMSVLPIKKSFHNLLSIFDMKQALCKFPQDVSMSCGEGIWADQQQLLHLHDGLFKPEVACGVFAVVIDTMGSFWNMFISLLVVWLVKGLCISFI